MATDRNGLSLAAREHLASGKPLTRIEAIILYGVANLPDIVKEMRRQGWIIRSRGVTYAAAMNRINEHAVLKAPPNLPAKEIVFTEYWATR
jgi:Helix-turn-helix domain